MITCQRCKYFIDQQLTAFEVMWWNIHKKNLTKVCGHQLCKQMTPLWFSKSKKSSLKNRSYLALIVVLDSGFITFLHFLFHFWWFHITVDVCLFVRWGQVSELTLTDVTSKASWKFFCDTNQSRFELANLFLLVW